jgi:muramoyltetrapeptide carboxypeptidase
MTRLLDRLDLTAMPRRPVIGFSDVTALHNRLHQRGLGPAIHGPVIHSLPKTDLPSLTHLFRLLAGQDTAPMQGETWVGGSVTAPLVGGNLCLLAATAGTPAQLDARGKILVLEEVGEPAYRIDRLVQQLASSGILADVAGLAIGQFVACRLPPEVSWTLRDILVEHFGPLNVPILADLPIGHGPQNHAWIVGQTATIDGSQLALHRL